MQSELLKLAIHLTQILETPSECHIACIPYIIDKIYDIDKASKKPGFGTPLNMIKYPKFSPDVP
jgi:hypothetical protein